MPKHIVEGMICTAHGANCVNGLISKEGKEVEAEEV